MLRDAVTLSPASRVPCAPPGRRFPEVFVETGVWPSAPGSPAREIPRRGSPRSCRGHPGCPWARRRPTARKPVSTATPMAAARIRRALADLAGDGAADLRRGRPGETPAASLLAPHRRASARHGRPSLDSRRQAARWAPGSSSRRRRMSTADGRPTCSSAHPARPRVPAGSGCSPQDRGGAPGAEGAPGDGLGRA